ncbi:hypothetical protein L208DRAFT_1132231, partial [Tricholoma matsutake]
TLANWNEILDNHMNPSNWKKLTSMVSSLLWKYKHARALVLSMEDAYKRLASMTSLENIRKWMEDAKAAQNNRETNVRSMDYFALNINKVPGQAEMQLQLATEELTLGHVGLVDLLVNGVKIQELQ